MNNIFKLKTANTYSGMQELMASMTAFLNSIAMTPASSRKVRLVIEELLTNIIKYGYEEGFSGTIEIAVYTNRKSLRLEFSDDAKAFDPTSARKKLKVDSIENLKIGGLGLIIVKDSCKRMKYKRHDGINFLSLSVPVSFENN